MGTLAGMAYHIVIGGGGGGGGVCLNEWSFMKGKNPCSNIGVYFLGILGRYCNTSRLHCRAVCRTMFSFIARGFEGMLFQENFKDFGGILECILMIL